MHLQATENLLYTLHSNNIPNQRDPHFKKRFPFPNPAPLATTSCFSIAVERRHFAACNSGRTTPSFDVIPSVHTSMFSHFAVCIQLVTHPSTMILTCPQLHVAVSTAKHTFSFPLPQVRLHTLIYMFHLNCQGFSFLLSLHNPPMSREREQRPERTRA